MATSAEFDDLKAAVEAEDTVIASAVAAFNGLAPLIEAVAGDKAGSIALAADVRAQAAALAAAIPVNTPADPPPDAP